MVKQMYCTRIINQLMIEADSDYQYKNRFWSASRYGCFRKLWYPQIIHFNRDFHYKPSILGYPHFWKHPYEFPMRIYEHHEAKNRH